MTNAMVDALSNLFSLGGLLGFLLGSAATRFCIYLRSHMKARKDPAGRVPEDSFKGLVFLWTLLFLITGYSGAQSYTTNNDLRELALSTQACQAEFNTSLRARAEITTENDKWSAIQRRAISDWLHEILLPPPDIEHIRAHDPNFGTNPRYVQWSIDVTRKYYDIIQKAQDEQDANAQERAKHQLPDPTCGR